jgi:hypothetical protein
MPLRFQLLVAVLVFGGVLETALAVSRRDWLYATGGACATFLGFALAYMSTHLQNRHRAPDQDDSTTAPDARE